jgi:hypothetical protein
MRVRARPRFLVQILCSLLVAASISGVFGTRANAVPPVVGDSSGGSSFGSTCAAMQPTSKEARCYEKLLLADIIASHNPARELPQLDAETRAAGGFIAGACHPLMHYVGRAYARYIHLTLAKLQKYLPKSNDPGCSAGFGHGLLMYLGPQVLKAGPRGALRICTRLSTRMQQYACEHGLGHAYMRVYGDYLRFALPACRALGRAAAPDCEQGAFHDYWIASTGRDATKRRPGLVTSPRVLCGVYRGTSVLACWYRVFVERPPASPVDSAAGIRRLCAGLHDDQRAGCVAGAALSAATEDPLSLVHLCQHLSGADVVSCLRAVPVENVDASPVRQLELIRSCSRLRGASRRGCDEWFGKTLAVVTNGAFSRRCGRLRSPFDRAHCRIGAGRIRAALVTFA